MTFDSDSILDACAPPPLATDSALRGEAGDDWWRSRLRAIVARRVVPQLASRQAHAAAGGTLAAMTADHAVALALLAVKGSPTEANEAVDGWLGDGIDVETMFLRVVAPAARHLGDLWLADRMSFLDVTRGSAVLQGLVRRHAPAFEAQTGGRSNGRSILLAPVPGEQHVLGLSMLAAFFRRAGWHVVFEPCIDGRGLLDLAGAQRFHAVGLSAAGAKFARRLPDLAGQLRAVSRVADLRVLAGGAAVLDGSASAADLGVDAIAHDAVEALRLAHGPTETDMTAGITVAAAA